ncbi:putative PGG domain, ankyrin repeat-containing domain superfamily [Helianthus debilis subsp. tardiflorus]
MVNVALQILKDHPDQQSHWLTIMPTIYTELFTSLAKNPDAFNMEEKNLITRIKERICRIFGMKGQSASEEDTDALKILKIVWKHATKRMSYDDIKDMLRGPSTTLDDGSVRYLSRVLFDAAEVGNTRFIAELLRTYHRLMIETNDDGHTLFHVAVMHRHQGVYNLLYEIAGSTKDSICQIPDKLDRNTLLHLIGKTSKEMTAKTYGASLLMQRELLWFQDVYNMTPPYAREKKNNAGQTPYELFSKENKELVSKGLDWMKDCMVVATLIVTVAFAVAFTVPGGYNQDHGLPVFTHQRAFLVFVIADAISLFTSSTSLLVFLTILTSGHGQRDFMYSLPKKLMIGILTLFISVAAMMVTFSASFFVLYHKGLKWVPILISIFATVPVIVFAALQFPLLVDMFRSMYDSRYLFNPKKHVLYPKTPKLHPKKST